MSDPNAPDSTEPTPADAATTAAAPADPPGTGGGTDLASPLDAAQRAAAESNERLLRMAAEFDNVRKRAARERQEAGWRAQGELVRGILEVLDDISRFAAVDPSTVDSTAVIEGMQLVEKKLHKSLAGHGFEVIDPTGHPFDPNLHEAIGTAPAPSEELDGIVQATYQVGDVINGMLLRPARCIVQQWSGATG